jgi:Ser/Thr protein kinase RdoA (MazF antagonist)
VDLIRAIIAERNVWLDGDQGWLAHGDFDATHIFQADGCYAGIIDFGEIRGADRWYDLGHFHLHDGERVPMPLLPWLLAGYRSVIPLPDDAEPRIAFASMLIAIRALARVRARHAAHPLLAHCLPALRRDIAFLAANLR